MTENEKTSLPGIYIHIPFCRKKCDYCDFFSTQCFDDKLMDDYLEALKIQAEIELNKSPIDKIDTIYFGGGTPSIFGGRRIADMISTLTELVNVEKNTEITVEVNPESVDGNFLDEIINAGVNRISMGFQSANDGELRNLGRIHTVDRAVNAFNLMRTKGINNISLDLMYGLEGQDMEAWKESLKRVAGLNPEHVSCYALKFEEGTPLYMRSPDLPDDDVQAEMYIYVIDQLGQYGMKQYEISNFAKPGFESRHNSKYWNRTSYIGLGCSAHGFVNNVRYSVISDINRYITCVNNRTNYIEISDVITEKDAINEYLMLKLRMNEGVEKDEFSLLGGDWGELKSAMVKYENLGFAKVSQDRICLTTRGFLLSNSIISDIVDFENEDSNNE